MINLNKKPMCVGAGVSFCDLCYNSVDLTTPAHYSMQGIRYIFIAF